jgi:hypothetical protein
VTTDNVNQEALDAPKPEPAAPPAHLIDANLIPERALEELGRYMSQADRDRLEAARIAGREQKRAAQQKAKEESDASSKRAADAVKEVVERDKATHEEDKPESDPRLLKPAEFELEVPDTLTESQKKVAAGYAEDVAAIAANSEIGQDEAQVILDTALDIAATIMPNGEEPNLANQDECIAVMNSRWGDVATKALIADSNKAVARLGQSVRDWLNTPNEFGEQIGNSPAAVYALAMWQRGHTRMSPEKAAAEVARLRATPEYQRGDKTYTDAVALVSKIAARGQSRELPMPAPKPAPILAPHEVERRKIEQEIAAIRSNKNYTSIDSKVRKPLVERMAALQAQLHG